MPENIAEKIISSRINYLWNYEKAENVLRVTLVSYLIFSLVDNQNVCVEFFLIG